MFNEHWCGTGQPWVEDHPSLPILYCECLHLIIVSFLYAHGRRFVFWVLFIIPSNPIKLLSLLSISFSLHCGSLLYLRGPFATEPRRTGGAKNMLACRQWNDGKKIMLWERCFWLTVRHYTRSCACKRGERWTWMYNGWYSYLHVDF